MQRLASEGFGTREAKARMPNSVRPAAYPPDSVERAASPDSVERAASPDSLVGGMLDSLVPEVGRADMADSAEPETGRVEAREGTAARRQTAGRAVAVPHRLEHRRWIYRPLPAPPSPMSTRA